MTQEELYQKLAFHYKLPYRIIADMTPAQQASKYEAIADENDGQLHFDTMEEVVAWRTKQEKPR